MARTPRDHFVPKAYLRGFTPEYIGGTKDGHLYVCYPGLGWVHKLSIKDSVACEPEFYDNHPIDKQWSATIEREWPKVRERLRNRESAPDLLDKLFHFMAAQYMRVPSFMNKIARKLAFEQARTRIHTIEHEGQKLRGMFIDQADTSEVVELIARFWPMARQDIERDYVWSLYHLKVPSSLYYLTSDNPCVWNPQTGGVTMPLALDMAMVGRIARKGEPCSFRHTNASHHEVAKVNRSTVAGSESNVYSHEKTEGLIRFLKKNHRERDIMEMGRSFENKRD